MYQSCRSTDHTLTEKQKRWRFVGRTLFLSCEDRCRGNINLYIVSLWTLEDLWVMMTHCFYLTGYYCLASGFISSRGSAGLAGNNSFYNKKTEQWQHQCKPTPPCATGIKLHLAEERQHNIICSFASYCYYSIINIRVASLQQTTFFFWSCSISRVDHSKCTQTLSYLCKSDTSDNSWLHKTFDHLLNVQKYCSKSTQEYVKGQILNPNVNKMVAP